MIKWLYNKIKKTPTCNCGWKMKQVTKQHFDYYWECVWTKCSWSTFQSDNGKLHWFK